VTLRESLPWAQYVETLQPHERPMMPGSPASPDKSTPMRLAFGAVGMLVILAGSMGSAVVTANIQNLQGALGVTPVEAAWLPVVYVMTNACMGLILVKFRQQYGLRLFAQIFLMALVAVSFAHLFVNDFTSALAVRAASGMAAAGLSTLGILYLLQAFPAEHRTKGLVLGIGGGSFSAPMARLFAPRLLEIGGWRAFDMLELGLALVALAAVFALRLPPSERTKSFEPLDFLTFILFAPGVALLAAVLGLGRLVWWTEAAWIGWALIGSIVLLTAALAVEHNRRHPLLSLDFLAGADIVRLALAILLVRIVLSEQTSGAVGFLQQMALGPDQLYGLFWAILAGAVAGSLVSAFTLNAEKLNLPIAIALGLITFGAFLDTSYTSLTRPPQVLLSQTLLAFAAALFIGPALLIGVTSVTQKGFHNVVSFVVVFQVGQNIGGLAGPALVGTLETVREKYHSNQLAEAVTLGDPDVVLRLQQLSGAYGHVILDPDRRNVAGLSLLTQQITQQAHVLAYNDVSLVIAALAALGCAWVSLHHLKDVMALRSAPEEAS